MVDPGLQRRRLRSFANTCTRRITIPPARERKTAIASYVEYVLRPRGPMIFGEPESEFLAPDDPDYEVREILLI